MEMVGVSYAANNRAAAEESKTKRAVENVQREFLSQVSQGVDSRDAFLNSIQAMNDNHRLDNDTLVISNKAAIGSVKPSDVKPWLELIAFAIPIIKDIIDLIESGKPKVNEK